MKMNKRTNKNIVPKLIKFLPNKFRTKKSIQKYGMK